MTWINSLLEDETIFPSKIGVQFPPNFRDIAHRIMRRLFRIYAHIYCRHLQEKVFDRTGITIRCHLETSWRPTLKETCFCIPFHATTHGG